MQKGICYGNDAFPNPYDPSTANNSLVFFGSDSAADHIAPLWGGTYTSSTGSYCQDCRNDLRVMKDMGVEVIRLYDWDPRNRHANFLDACGVLGIGVLATVSNYFLQPGGGLPNMCENITTLINSFSGQDDYHPAIIGTLIGNEFDLDGSIGLDNCAKFTLAWDQIEREQYPSYRRLPIGHPVSFAKLNKFPSWHIWDQLLPRLSSLKSRLFLAPQTYNDAAYLFQNAEGSGKGYLDLTYEQYSMPIWITEIGQDRTKPNYAETVTGQLKGCLDYSNRYPTPTRLVGACFFSYADKIWMQGSSEGAFGAFTHKGAGDCTIIYGASDFTHWDVPDYGTLNVDVLDSTPLYAVVKSCYDGTQA